MAIIPRPTVSRLSWKYYFSGAIVLAAALGLALTFPFGHPLRWGAPPLLGLGAWFGVRWYRERTRSRAQHLIALRLDRLPADFTVLHGLVIPAPWGKTRLDHLVISRFGLVVVADGTGTRWMLEQVEAVRSLLFAQGHKSPLIPVRPLVLIPPGTHEPAAIESDAPVIRVEQVRLQHVAPSSTAVLSSEQVTLLTRQLSEFLHIL